MKNNKLKMGNDEKAIKKVSNNYLSFGLMYKKEKIALLNIDAEDCILYSHQADDAQFNTWLKDFKDKKLILRLTRDAGKWQIVSNREVLINGVAWRKRVLKDGDKIYLGEYRLVFKGNFIEDIPPDPVPHIRETRKRIIRIFEAAAIVLGVSFLWFCSTLNHDTEIPAVEKEATIHHEVEHPYITTEEPDNRKAKNYPPNKKKLAAPLLVYSPTEDPVPQKLDMLFIHTHPDDESLDYGLYMAEAAAEGKSMGVILFTDGDSGFDKYPDRPIDGIYPDAELGYPDLAKVRVLEAEKALTVLGAKVYVRLGLWNRPYTSKEANKSINTLVSEWGGQDFLVDKLVHLIEIFKPDIIVSPDGPSKANEHFEHETVGYISEIAVNIYRQRNPGKLKAYLKLVDVQQTEEYAGTPLLDIDARGEPKYTEIKRKALMMHQTQADASYYGIKRLLKFPFEYYILQYSSDDADNLVFSLLKNDTIGALSSPSL